MNEISKAQQADIAEFTTQLHRLAGEIDEAESAVTETLGSLNEKIQRYNNILKNVKDFRDGIVQSMHDYAEDKPESWKDGDQGSSYNDFMEAWEDADLEFIRQIEDIRVDEQDHAMILEELPLNPE